MIKPCTLLENGQKKQRALPNKLENPETKP